MYVKYLIKVNDIRTKKGVDLLQHLVEFYQAQNKYGIHLIKINHFKLIFLHIFK